MLPRQIPMLYDEVVDKYDIEILKVPGDWVIRDGDIALSKSRDFMLNDEVYSGLYRLVQSWRFSVPSLVTLFGLCRAAREQENEFNGVLNELRPLASADNRTRYHEANDQIDAAQLALQTYAGALLLVVNGILQAFKDDIEAPRQDWEKAGPSLGGYSVGAFIEAAANNFRHEDEWMKTREPMRRQLASIRVLESAFGKRFRDISGERFSPNIAPEALALLAAEDFENIGKRIFAFANELARSASRRNRQG